MGIVLGALGGLGESMQRYAETNQKAWLDDENSAKRSQRESDLSLEREKTMAEFKNNLANAPLTRLGAKAKELAGQEVPVTADRVTEATGRGAQEYEGPESQRPSAGIVGNYAEMAAQAKNLPPEDQAPYLAQLKKQFGSDQQEAEQAVAGKTRKRTADEALSAAADDAKINDPVAYADYESKIGKPKRDERRLDTAERKEDNRAAAAATSEERKAQADARRYEVEIRRLDLQQGSLDANNRKIDAWIENEATKRDTDEKKANNPKAGTPERMGSIVNAMNATIKNLDDNRPKSTDTDEQKAEWRSQLDNAKAVRARAMDKLNRNFDDGAPLPTPVPTPAPAGKTARPPLSQFLKKD